jgi:LysR family transcriptional regulator, benzoate and cis,cis-muconate-responsive activator of ben and cat genes
MELRHLRYFVAVAEEENITRAAERLHVSQPPLSRQIRDLEEELGVQLLRRDAKSVRLTEAGRIFCEEARAVLKRADEAMHSVRMLAKGARKHLHIGYAPSLTVEILPAALRAFEGSAPGTRVSLHDLSTAEMIDRLAEGKLDVALIVRPGRGGPRGLHWSELRRYPVCVAVPAGHAFAEGRSPGLRRIFSERLLVYTRSDYPEYAEWLERIAPAGFTVAEEHDSSSSLVAAVEAGRGVALVPSSFACFAGMRLVVRQISGAVHPIVVGVALPENPLPEARAFVEAARMAAGNVEK